MCTRARSPLPRAGRLGAARKLLVPKQTLQKQYEALQKAKEEAIASVSERGVGMMKVVLRGREAEGGSDEL